MKHLSILLLMTGSSFAAVQWNSAVSNCTYSLNGVASNESAAVAVGDSGTILCSADGITWNPAVSNTAVKLNGVTYGNGKFCAVGDSGTILISADGNRWNSVHSGEIEQFYAVTCGNGKFCTVGSAGLLAVSTDGTAWKIGSTGPENTLYAVGWDGTKFIGGGWYLWAYNAYGIITESADAESWEMVYDGSSKEVINGICDSSAAGKGGRWYHGSQGSWISGTTGAAASIHALYRDTTGYWGVGSSGTVIRSSDGMKWTSEQSGITKDLKAAAGFKGSLIAVGAAGTILAGKLETTAVSARRVQSVSPVFDRNTRIITGISGHKISGELVSLSGKRVGKFEGIGSAEIPSVGIGSGVYILNWKHAGSIGTIKSQL